MVRFLISAAMFLAAAAIGLLVANLLLDDVSVSAASFVWVVLVFAVLQAVLAPFFLKTTRKNAPALMGATGLIATYVALVVASLVTDGLTITGLSTWVVAGVVVWLASMLAAFLLPLLLVRKAVEERRA
ncbi:hypothetical protein [Cellulomonas soli]